MYQPQFAEQSLAALVGLSHTTLVQVKTAANSKKKCSAQVAKLVFTKEERSKSNYSGQNGKDKLASHSTVASRCKQGVCHQEVIRHQGGT